MKKSEIAEIEAQLDYNLKKIASFKELISRSTDGDADMIIGIWHCIIDMEKENNRLKRKLKKK